GDVGPQTRHSSMTLTRAIGVLLLLAFAGPPKAQACYESSIVSPAPFMGNNGEIFKLSDGTIWEVKYEYEYMYEYYPTVIVCPDRGKLAIDGKMLNVRLIGGGANARGAGETGPAEIIESRIDGEFEGWEGETVFKLLNGQIWQQIDGRYKYRYR